MNSIRSVAGVTYHRTLNNQQVEVLDWLYRFRFSTSRQIARCLGKDKFKSVQKKLQILEKQGYIGKRYDGSYKLQGRPAEYYLTPKGARQLEQVKPNATSQQVVKY